MAAAEMLRALALYRQMTPQPAAAAEVGEETEETEPIAAPAAEAASEAAPETAARDTQDATVTPIAASQRKRGDGPPRP